MTDKQKQIFSNAKLGTMRIVFKGNKIVAQIVYEAVEPEQSDEGNVMGVDLGIKCPAVSYSSDGNVKFYGNGRKNKYMRRHFKTLRKKLQKAKHIKAVKRIKNKEQRIMKDIDHKVSRAIVNTAVAHKVKTIKMEKLANIRSTTRRSRKNNHSLHTWSFYRLANFIEYKAKLAGIKVEYVDPAYTSQRCPVCGCIEDENRISQEEFCCVKCGHKDNADHNAAVNIRNRVLEAVQKDLLKQNDNGSWSPKNLKREKIKEILLKSTGVQDTKGTTEGIRDLKERNFS